MSEVDLSVVLPVYNEERALAATFERLVPALEALLGPQGSFEIVCVDDGSTDKSRAILEELRAREPRLQVMALPANRGKGAAVKTGVLATRGKRIFFMDADLSTPLEEMPAFLGALESGYDVVIGNRRTPGARITRHQPKLRETLGKGFTMLVRTLLAPGVSDFTCGFKAFRRDAAREIFSRVTIDGWAFDAELVVIALVQEHRLAQVPVAWHHEDNSKVRLARAIPSSLLGVLRIRWQRLLGRYR
jgi:dolichyl-phosphate beta-glucosyltransferase